MSKQSGKKQSGPKGPINRNKNCKGLPSKTSMTHCDIVEERKCPLEGCNSMGHLGGCYDKHFTIDACPTFHNKTVQECKEMYEERLKKEEDRKKAMMVRGIYKKRLFEKKNQEGKVINNFFFL